MKYVLIACVAFLLLGCSATTEQLRTAGRVTESIGAVADAAAPLAAIFPSIGPALAIAGAVATGGTGILYQRAQARSKIKSFNKGLEVGAGRKPPPTIPI